MAQRRLEPRLLVRGQAQEGAEDDAGGRRSGAIRLQALAGEFSRRAWPAASTICRTLSQAAALVAAAIPCTPITWKRGQAEDDVHRHRDQAEAHGRLGVRRGRRRPAAAPAPARRPARPSRSGRGSARYAARPPAVKTPRVKSPSIRKNGIGDQGRGGGRGQGQGEDHRLVGGRLGVVVVLGLDGAGEPRQQGHADRHPDQAERKLVEARGDLRSRPGRPAPGRPGCRR